MKKTVIELNSEDLQKDLFETAKASINYAGFVQENIDESEEITYKAFLPFLALIDLGSGTNMENALREATGRYIACHRILLDDDTCLENIKSTLKNLIESIESMELGKVEKLS